MMTNKNHVADLLELLKTISPIHSAEIGDNLADIGFDSMSLLALQVELVARGFPMERTQDIDLTSISIGDLALLVEPVL